MSSAAFDDCKLLWRRASIWIVLYCVYIAGGSYWAAAACMKELSIGARRPRPGCGVSYSHYEDYFTPAPEPTLADLITAAEEVVPAAVALKM